jgi:hypothetical protein
MRRSTPESEFTLAAPETRVIGDAQRRGGAVRVSDIRDGDWFLFVVGACAYHAGDCAGEVVACFSDGD